MKKLFSISRAAELANMTAETLRHYDRVGLVHPCKTEDKTGYRYYSEEEIIRLNIIHALRLMEIPLKEIKKILEVDDMEELVKFLGNASRRADEKIAELRAAKKRIERAETFYAGKNVQNPQQGVFLRTLPERTILLSDKLSEPTIDNLWNYHRHYYAQVGAEKAQFFAFEDLAGIFETEKGSRLFAVCTRFCQTEGLVVLPQGRYLCAECTDKTYDSVLKLLFQEAEQRFSVRPALTLRIIVLTGILQWKYEAQIFIG